MKELPADKINSDFHSVLDHVAEGETIMIMRDGKPFARIIPEPTFDREQARKAVEVLIEWRNSQPKTGITVEEILSARDEGRR